MIALFVTGTDTGVGKTTVSCAILAAARARGLRTAAMKPVETGCAPPADEPTGPLIPADASALDRATRADPRAETSDREDDRSGDHRFIAPRAPSSTVFRFAAPLAPSVAAEREGGAVTFAPILRAADRLRSLSPDLFLVEGAGGLLVPISDSTDMADLAAALATPLLIVARDGLGTINHTLLTLEAAAARRLPVVGVVLSAVTAGTDPRDAARNAHEIARRGRVPVLGCLPHSTDLSLASLASAAEAHLALDRLLGPPSGELR
ncbi:MAG TPA: dethiobiotin synthase [Kofleriaceae bacterium]|nr:dethiobiotin synthase [Kofleriaceae bacterium]